MMPAQIGRYIVKKELGRGGMAAVYFAHDPRFKRDVAVKVLPAQFLGDPIFRARFEREAQMIAALEHPAIVPVYDFGEEGEELYLVMRYMPGGSLADRLRKGHLNLAESSAILSRLAPALDEVHSHGLVHRDLKPANILFDGYGNAYLSDFGIARAAEGASSLTGDAIIGTPAYMSPEQALGDPHIDARSDIYAMGAILFEMLAGKQPYQATTPMGVAMKHITEPVPRLLEAKADLHPACEGIILRAMAKERERRYGSASELARELEAIVAASSSAASAPVQAPAPDEKQAAGQMAPTQIEPEPEAPAEQEAPMQKEPIAPAAPAVAEAAPPSASPVRGAASASPPRTGAPGSEAALPKAPQSGTAGKSLLPAAARKMPLWGWISGCIVLAALCGLSVYGAGLLGGRMGLFGRAELTASPTAELALNQSQETPTQADITPTVSTRPEVISTLRPIQLPESGKILFQDDFDDPESGWERDSSSTNLMADYYHGSYRILVNEPYYIVWGLLNLDAPDVIIDVEVTKASGPPEDFFGVICRYQDRDNYYFLTIASDGFYVAGKMKDGEEIVLGNPGTNSAVHQGNTTNRVRAECVGDTLSLYANNTRLIQVEDRDFTSGAIGLMGRTFGTPGTNLLFDNILVSQP